MDFREIWEEVDYRLEKIRLNFGSPILGLRLGLRLMHLQLIDSPVAS